MEEKEGLLEKVKKNESVSKIADLLKVKSLVTLALTGIFSTLALKGAITGSEFLTVFTTVIAFYFGVQHEKKEKE